MKCCLLLLSCIILCSCSSEEETKHENSPSIHDCPPEDIAWYPTQEEPPDGFDTTGIIGSCATDITISQKELLFDAQGGVRCITTAATRFGLGIGSNNPSQIEHETNQSYNCELYDNESEYEWPLASYRNLKCSWLTSTKVENRVVHIRVDKNETGKERKIVLNINDLYCAGFFSVIQSAK